MTRPPVLFYGASIRPGPLFGKRNLAQAAASAATKMTCRAARTISEAEEFYAEISDC
jgi:hypothetical protein